MHAAPRPEWKIDQSLKSLEGSHVRVLARSFIPYVTFDHKTKWPPIDTRDVLLPDNRRAENIPVYFEGKLKGFRREVGVVWVSLDASDFSDGAPDGFYPFREGLAVIMRGPALVELRSPFSVERLPSDGLNYWKDVQFPRVQFEFPFSP